MTDDRAVWGYAIGTAPAPDGLADLTGVAGSPVRTVTVADLVATVSSVPCREFGAEALRGHLEDLAWLDRTARSHHRVIEAVARFGPLVPFRFAAVYRGDARVRAMLADRRDALAAALARVAGRAEWGVKGYLVPGRVRPEEPTGGTDRPGTAYLRQRRADLTARDEARRAATSGARQVHADLARIADAARQHPPQHPELTGRAEPMVLNGAYLVDTALAGRFRAAVDQVRQRQPVIEIELTGPWPPYSFASVEESPP